MVLEIKNRWTNAIIFSHSCENNTMSITLALALKKGVDLSNARLRRATLIGVDLSNARLHGVTLCHAKIANVDLSFTDLSYADCANAEIDLNSVSLTGADLRGTHFSEKTAKEIAAKYGFHVEMGYLVAAFE